MSTSPVILIILDGFGINARKEGNAIAAARTPNLDALQKIYPTSRLSMSGADVGLPAGQMGNSEVGHMILGAGRIVYQDLTLIHKAIDNGTFFRNPVLLETLLRTKSSSDRLHLLGLLGDGGVHSHQRHMEAIIDLARREKLSAVYLHLFLDVQFPFGCLDHQVRAPGLGLGLGTPFHIEEEGTVERLADQGDPRAAGRIGFRIAAMTSGETGAKQRQAEREP